MIRRWTCGLLAAATLAVPAGSAVTVPLATALDGRAGTLHLTSDTAITSQAIRRIVTLHSFAAFVFNIGVIAFTINALGGSH